MNQLKVIVTGATGMVGEGVMHTCLNHPAIEEVLVINRKPCGVSHPKLKEIIQLNFFDLSAIKQQLAGYDGCFFCLGVSSIGMKEAEYFRLTYELTLNFARTLEPNNPDLTFCYISGTGTDSSEKGRSMWARVKGKTENDLMRLNFKQVYAVRPGFIKPMDGMKHTHGFYKYVNWLFKPGRKFFPKMFCTLEELALCMINLTLIGYSEKVVEGKDIIKIAAIN
jgi:uncharacterized protein YbjT (DUF2867 family)